jgi:hypothetical protein
MNIQTISLIISDTLRAATPLIFAALGELVTEKSGMLKFTALLLRHWLASKLETGYLYLPRYTP